MSSYEAQPDRPTIEEARGPQPPAHRRESGAVRPRDRTRRRANLLLSAILVPLGVLTLIAMVLLWPSGDRSSLDVASPYATADGVSFETGTVREVAEADCPSSQPTVDAGGAALTWPGAPELD